MFRRVCKCAALVVLPASCLLADFSYEQTSKMTGGAMAGMMKFAGAFSKQLREPIRSTVAVKGDRMVHWSQYNASVIDLSNETITTIDFQKKQYYVMTFAETAKAMEEASQKLKDSKKEEGAPEITIKVSVNETGQTRQISGYDTKEAILKIEMETKDPKSGKTSTMVVTSDSWLAPKVAGYDEVTDFYKRMSQKISWAPGSTGMFAGGRSDISKAMAEMYKEGSKLNGIPVYQVTKIGLQGMGNEGAGTQTGEQGQAQQQQQQSQQQQQQVEKPSVGGALGSAIGGRFGGLGGFGRKRKPKEEPAPETAQQSTSAPAPAAQQPAPQGAPDGSPSLMEMTSEMTGFSATADGSKFEVPAGFKQVEADKRGK